MAYGEIPRGLADLGVYVLEGDTPGDKVDVPGVRALNFTVESDSDQLEGDNSVIALVRNPKRVTGSIEVGQINLAAMAALTGGTATTTGSTPNRIIELEEEAQQAAQYVQVIGQTPSQDQNGSAYRITLAKVLVTSGPDESLQVNEWSTPTLDFEGIPIGGVLLARQNYETETALPA